MFKSKKYYSKFGFKPGYMVDMDKKEFSDSSYAHNQGWCSVVARKKRGGSIDLVHSQIISPSTAKKIIKHDKDEFLIPVLYKENDTYVDGRGRNKRKFIKSYPSSKPIVSKRQKLNTHNYYNYEHD